MNRIILIILLGIGGGLATPGQSQEPPYAKQVTRELTTWSATFSHLEWIKTAGHRAYYRVVDRSGDSSNILIITSAAGRYDRFDLMVLLKPDQSIGLIRILKYRSQYGAEVTNKRWLAQFYDQPATSIALRKNVDAISGATFSATGLVEEINGILAQGK